MDKMKKICEELNKLLTFDVEIVMGCNEPYLCIFSDKSRNDDIMILSEVAKVGHMVKSVVDKYYSDVCVLTQMSLNSNDNGSVSCVFRMEKPMLSKEVLKSEYGVDCNWQNEDNCIYQDECISFGECVYIQEWEDMCL